MKSCCLTDAENRSSGVGDRFERPYFGASSVVVPGPTGSPRTKTHR